MGTPGFVVTRPGQLRAWFQGNEIDVCDVLALTPGSLWLEPDAVARGDMEAAPPLASGGRLWVGHHDEQLGPFGVQMGSVASPYELPCRDRRRTLLTTMSEGLEAHRRLASWISGLRERGVVTEGLASVHHQGNPERVVALEERLELLHFFNHERSPAYVVHMGVRTRARIEEVDPRSGSIYWWLEGPVPKGPATVLVLAPYAVYSWPVFDLSQGHTRIPEWIGTTAHRKRRRGQPPAGTFVRMTHPQWGSELQLERAVRDIGLEGLSFQGDLERDLLYPGLFLPEIRLSTPDGGEARLRGEVRSIHPSRPGAGDGRIGVRLFPQPDCDDEAFRELLDRTLYPTTKGRGLDGWQVYVESGYFHLSGKQPEDFRELHAAYEEVTQKLETASEVAHLGYWPKHGAAAAAVLNVRVASSCWMLCHVSKKPRLAASSRRGLREAYMRVYERAAVQPGTRWFMTYVQDSAPTWSRRVHADLPARFVSTGEGYTVPFRALEYAVEAPSAMPDTELRLEAVDTNSIREVLEDLKRLRPPAYLDALDMTPERWDLRASCAQWHAAGLERERAWVALYDGDRRVAMAALERTAMGVHLYGLMDCMRVYIADPAWSEAALRTLVSHARHWYGERGRGKFVLLAEDGCADAAPLQGQTDLGGATLSLLAAARLPELLQMVCSLSSTHPPAPRSAAQTGGIVPQKPGTPP